MYDTLLKYGTAANQIQRVSYYQTCGSNFSSLSRFTLLAMLDYVVLLSCLQFAVSNSVYYNTILKPKQVLCLEYVYLKNDVLCVFHLTLMFAKARLEQDAGPSFWSMDMSIATTIVIVVLPLNALISNQIACLCSNGIRASVLGIKKCLKTQKTRLNVIDEAHCILEW